MENANRWTTAFCLIGQSRFIFAFCGIRSWLGLPVRVSCWARVNSSCMDIIPPSHSYRLSLQWMSEAAIKKIHSLSWSMFVNTHIYYCKQWFNMHIGSATVIGTPSLCPSLHAKTVHCRDTSTVRAGRRRHGHRIHYSNAATECGRVRFTLLTHFSPVFPK